MDFGRLEPFGDLVPATVDQYLPVCRQKFVKHHERTRP
jgi:hypothetical protein